MSINVTTLVGRLVKDVDLKNTSQGTPVGTFTLAVNRNFKNADGNTEADFINCVIWRKSAELMANMAKKGSLVGITGRIQTRSYENQQGKRVYVTEVVADNFQMLEYRQNNGQQGTFNQSKGNYPKNNKNVSEMQRDPFEGNGRTFNDDDLPF